MHPTINDVTAALSTFIRKRPGLDKANYFYDFRDAAGRSAYLADARAIQQDLADAMELLLYVQDAGITAGELIEASRNDRLELEPTEDGVRVEFTTCQYRPIEYRKAASRVLSRALWNYWREQMPGCDADAIRARARNELGFRISRRYFE